MLFKVPPLRLKPLDVLAYKLADDFSGLLICLMVVFSPWAFGTTVRWAIWTMNIAGYVLGLALFLKLSIRLLKGYKPPRWLDSPKPLFIALCVVTFLLLLYCLIAAMNARATFIRLEYRFEYYDCLRWLPHSLDSTASWVWFWNYLALGLSFWATRDWLLGKASQDLSTPESAALLPGRLRLLLWVLALNGALLGIEGIIQRLEGSGKLLFLVQPRVNPMAQSQFGPWAYRGSAASYFNLLWPACVGFWWALQRKGHHRGRFRHLILGCAAVMAACPFVSTSRGGAFIAIALIVSCVALMLGLTLLTKRGRTALKSNLGTLALVIVFGALASGLGVYYGWKDLKPRLDDHSMREGFNIREEMNIRALPMARDYPIFGTGPGTFEPVFSLYRQTEETYWPAQLHNDWLETRITFGWAGCFLIAAAFAIVIVSWFAPGGIHGTRRLVLLTWLGLAGCLAHARFDMPFQIYSILFLWVVFCAMLASLTRHKTG